MNRLACWIWVSLVTVCYTTGSIIEGIKYNNWWWLGTPGVVLILGITVYSVIQLTCN